MIKTAATSIACHIGLHPLCTGLMRTTTRVVLINDLGHAEPDYMPSDVRIPCGCSCGCPSPLEAFLCSRGGEEAPLNVSR